ncbi:antileukoproteinase-like [Ascaphus truei]|uniref:antileukoproteinase-like n=1 Tax=Ascaphus truei TaxID=8439 RepID=UPI003F5A3B30
MTPTAGALFLGIVLCSLGTWAAVTAVKLGKCPPIVELCVQPLPEPTCECDSDCTGNQKCCDHCGFKCLDPAPVTVKPGECPAMGMKCPIDDEVLDLPKPWSCSNDNDCEGEMKCCGACQSYYCFNPVSSE